MKYSMAALLCLLGLTAAVWGEEATLKVAEAAAKEAAVSKVMPEYPQMAKQMRLAGRVEVEAVIDPEGNVEKTQVVSGNALLSGAAANALKRWKFTPFTSGGKPVRAVTTIAFDFKL